MSQRDTHYLRLEKALIPFYCKIFYSKHISVELGSLLNIFPVAENMSSADYIESYMQDEMNKPHCIDSHYSNYISVCTKVSYKIFPIM